MRHFFAVSLAVLAAGAAAPTAHAATVSVERSAAGTIYVSVIGGAERDVLTISSPAGDRFAVTQVSGAPLSAGRGCVAAGSGLVECKSPNVAGALLVGGGGDDALAVSGAVGWGAWLFGGDGKDELTAGPGADRLDGGAGADVLRARDGRKDALYCGSEPDAVHADDFDDVAGDCETRLAGAPAAPPVEGPVAGPMPLPVTTPAVTPPPAPVGVAGAPVTLSHGAAPVRISCKADSRCAGWITVRLLPRRRGTSAVAAAARRPVIGRRRYRVGAGKSAAVRVRISRRGRTRVLARRRARCSVRISMVAPDGTKLHRTERITIEAGGGR